MEKPLAIVGSSVSSPLTAAPSPLVPGATTVMARHSGHVRIYQRNSNGTWEQLGADIDGEGRRRFVSDGASHSPLTAAPSPLAPLATTAMAAMPAMCASISATSTAIGSNSALTSMEKPLAITREQRLLSADGRHRRHWRPATTAMASIPAMCASISATSTGNWEQLGADIDGEAAGDYSGYSVSLSADGSTVAIGAMATTEWLRSGHVRIYQRNAQPTPGSNSALTSMQKLRRLLRISVSLSADGSTVAIGASGNDGNGSDSGHVRIYQRNSKRHLGTTRR